MRVISRQFTGIADGSSKYPRGFLSSLSCSIEMTSAAAVMMGERR